RIDISSLFPKYSVFKYGIVMRFHIVQLIPRARAATFGW
ncbi:unnamed protein product, partial [marine sediment metagenome]